MDNCTQLLSRWTGGIEIMMDGPSWHEPVNWDTECNRFQNFKGPLSVHGPIWELNLASARYPAIREYSYEVYKECLEWCARIGAEHMVIHPNLYSTPLFSRAQSQYFAKESLKRLGEEAQKLNVVLAVENVGIREYALFDQEEYIRLYEEISTVSALVDVGHAHVNGWDIPSLIRSLGAKIKAVHLHDNDGQEDLHQPIGQGTIEWELIWSALHDLNHPFRAILEYGDDASLELLLEHGRAVEKKLLLNVGT
ncbi:MAG TPA: TIM barrel protein [Candidatus Paenibacillus intestinavium]|nr:TIM barrel protein [Candidatus Paenibacillus intestinavium]